MDALICIDIGNQWIKTAFFDSAGQLCRQERHGHAEAASLFLSLSQIAPLYISDVAGICDSIALPPNAHKLNIADKFPFAIDYKSPTSLGMDRLCGLAGALFLEPAAQAILVLNAGTCLTIDFLDSDRVYRGGTISPGLALRFQSMHSHTAKLPLVKPAESWEPMGIDTETSIRSGVQTGYLAEITHAIQNILEKQPHTTVFLTGGEGFYFADKIKSKIFAAPNLTLYGLYSIAKHNAFS